MRFTSGCWLSVITFGLAGGVCAEDFQPKIRAIRESAPPPPSIEVRSSNSARRAAKPAAGLSLYSIGDPSDVEQEYLELLNRARLDPAGEGVRLRDTTNQDVRSAYYQLNGDGTVRWSVDTNYFVQVMTGFPPVPPLAFNPKLINAARGHSLWMFNEAVQDHDEHGVSPGQRVENAGYDWAGVAENIFSYARSAYHGHAGFEVDWGEGPHGMQEPAGHRLNNHSSIFTEVGIGVHLGVNSVQINGQTSTVGPQVVTVDFALPQDRVSLVTGVAYYDLNGNGLYDAGEGIGGIQVDVTGSSYYALTANSGGYAVPAPKGLATVAFSADGMPSVQKSVTVPENANVKADLVLPYNPPAINGSLKPGINIDNAYTVSPVPGATGYRVRTVRLLPGTVTEGAEAGTGNLIVHTDPGYQFITTDVTPLEGTRVFHLVHNGTAGSSPSDQWIQFRPRFRATASTVWSFGTMLGYATDIQVARAQVSTDDGATWQDVWTQAGTGGKGETSFGRKSVSLASFNGKEFLARIGYTLGFGSYYYQIDKEVGLYLDDSRLAGVEVIQEVSSTEVPANGTFSFRPTTESEFALSAQPKISGRTLAAGPFLSVNAVVAPIPVTLGSSTAVLGPNGKLRLDFSVLSGAPKNFQLERRDSLQGAWTPVADAVLSVNSPGSYSYRLTPSGSQGFYRVTVP